MEKLLNFSIIIAAKNEAANLIPLLESLAAIEYPAYLFEIIIVDDNSTDDTSIILQNALDKFPMNIKVVCSGDKQFPAKKGALNIGISEASNEYILITDADCRPSPKWLSLYSEKFSKGYDFLFAAAPFYLNDKMVNMISCFENLRSSLLVSSFAKLKLPYSASARNFGFKKSSFLAIGGYKNTTETLSGDDDLLLREAVKNKMSIGYIDDKNAAVFSFAKSNFKDYLKQKKRHTKTSLHYLPLHQLLLAVWHVLNLFFLFAPLIFLDTRIGPSLFIIKIITDIIIVKANEKKFNYTFRITEIPTLQIIYEFIIIINFANALFGKDEWK